MKEILEWLKKPDYDAGLELYLKHGDNSFLKSLFSSGSTPYNSDKLKEELCRLVMDSIPLLNEENVKEPEAPVKSQTDNTFLIRKLEYDLQQIHRAIDNNMFQLRRAKSEKTRREYAFQLLKLQSKKFAKYQEKDHLVEFGCLPSSLPKPVFTTPEIQRLYVQINKAKKRLEKTDLRNRAKTENLLAEKESRLQQLISERI